MWQHKKLIRVVSYRMMETRMYIATRYLRVQSDCDDGL
jgi:hypothetical protein